MEGADQRRVLGVEAKKGDLNDRNDLEGLGCGYAEKD